ncbi:sodium/proline symporter [Marine Group III euryarchaeote]|nr:sodium/proline symporter [Marine Group III euryarchaeote]
MDIAVILSFIFFMTIFAGVGLASMRVKKDTTDDYLVAGRGMSPSLAALSAVSTWNSGYMFIGFIGFTYTLGYPVAFLAFMSTIGQFVAWMWLYKFIQKEGKERGVRSLSSLVAEKAGAPEAKLAGILSVLFLSIYAAAQLTSGGKALFVMMEWPEIVGILIGFVLVVAYCYAGGIRASIWTDAAQSCVMLVGSTILCWISIQEVGGLSGLKSGLNAQDPALTNLLPPNLMFGLTLWIAAFFLGGLSVAGQPQVVSRVMTLGNDKDRREAMIWFFVWQTPFIVLMLIIGLASRVLFTESDFDAELGLPMMAMETMPAIGVGMILASIFAATMSTADSQVLACTAAITDDIKPEWNQDHATTKKVTIAVAAFATLISIGGLYVPGGDSVFQLVVFAVYGLGGVFVPLLIIRWAGYKPDTTHSISMMVAAFSGVFIWTVLGFDGADGIFPSVPGMGAAFATHFTLNYMRTPKVAPLGRFSLPKRSQYGAIAAAIIIPFGAVEATYLFGAPESSDSMGGIGDYSISGTISYETLGNNTEYVGDGETILVDFNTNDIEWTSDNRNVVGVRVLLTYGEDETSNGLGCAAPGASQPDPDTITGTLTHDDFNGTESGQNQGQGSSSHEVLVEWYNSSLYLSGNATGMSESEIKNELDSMGAGLGLHFLEINVEAESGNAAGCNHTDNGEEVEYLVEVVLLEYEITPA